MSKTIAQAIDDLLAEIEQRKEWIAILRRLDGQPEPPRTAVEIVATMRKQRESLEFSTASTRPVAPELVPGGGTRRKSVDMDRARELHAQGLTDSKIAEQLGVSQANLSLNLRKAGLPPNGTKGVRKLPPEPVERVEGMAVVLAFLRGRDVSITRAADGHYACGDKILTRDEVIAMANVKRELMNKPPFEVMA